MAAHATSPAAGDPPSTPSAHSGVLTRLSTAAADIKLAHSVFALPFAILAAFLARDPARGWGVFAGQLALVVLCMVLARTWAMLVNRIADRSFDAANPRTARRAVASGRLPLRDATRFAAASAAAFVAATALFLALFANPWPLLLSIPVLVWIAFYSFTKRFTSLCHIFLGGALAASPLAAAIAVDPAALLHVPAIPLLAAMVLFWVAGFDVIYALQDLDFDRQAGLNSIPARLGAGGAIRTSRAMHAVAFLCLVLAARADPRLSLIFWLGVAAVGLLLILEHAVLARRGKAGLEMAFFTINGIVSCILGTAGVIDTLWTP